MWEERCGVPPTGGGGRGTDPSTACNFRSSHRPLSLPHMADGLLSLSGGDRLKLAFRAKCKSRHEGAHAPPVVSRGGQEKSSPAI